MVKRLQPHHLRVLTALDEMTQPAGEMCVGFAPLARELEMDRREVRRIVRHLARGGLAEYHRALCDYDGMFRGAGYCISRRGRAVLVVASDGVPEDQA